MTDPVVRGATVPDLGVGLGLRVPHLRHILGTWPQVDFFEIISENFMVDGGLPLRNLDAVLDHYPVVCHGVSMGLGSADPLDRDHLAALKRLVKRTGTPWVSEHLCWSRHNNAHLHDLLPLPYTVEVADFVAAKAAFVQDSLGVPFALENLSSYVAFRQSQLTEWDFYRRVVETAGCFMMLDVNNIYVSSVNHGFDPWDYLAAIPWERVIQVHIAGHTVRPDGTLLDTHDHPVCDEVWQLYAHACRMTGGVSTLLEWDDNFLSFPETLAEANRARRFRSDVLGQRPLSHGRVQAEPRELPMLSTLQAGFARSIRTPLRLEEDGYSYQVEFYDPEVVASMLPGPTLGPVERLAVYNEQYWFRLLTVAQDELPLLGHLVGLPALNQLITDYLTARPSQHPGLHRLLDGLPDFLSDQPTWIQQAAAVDLAWQRVFFAASQQVLDAAQLDPQQLAALLVAPLCFQPAFALVAEDWQLMELRGRVVVGGDSESKQADPTGAPPPEAPGWWAISGTARGPAVQALTRTQYLLLQRLHRGQALALAIAELAAELDAPALSELGQGIQAWFERWARLGWFAAPAGD